jgi:hypothetical protein
MTLSELDVDISGLGLSDKEIEDKVTTLVRTELS